MRRETKTYLYDIMRACELLEEFTAGARFDDYLADPMMRSAVERQFEIIGEALRQMLEIEPQLADAITDAPRIIAFRNILIHGYAAISHDTVWGVLEADLPRLQDEVGSLLAG